MFKIDSMRFLSLGVICILLLFASCSFLIKESVLLNKKSENWKRTETCQRCESFGWFTKYDYKYCTSTCDNLTISVCPSLYGFTITFGPPIVPVIPSPNLFISSEWENHPFFVDLMFQKFKGNVTDLGSIDFIFNKQNIKIDADSVFLLSQSIQRFEGEIGLKRITDSKYLIECDTTRIRFYFHVHRNKVRKLSIDFTKLKVNNNFVPFTKINFWKRSRFLYDPFVLGH